MRGLYRTISKVPFSTGILYVSLMIERNWNNSIWAPKFGPHFCTCYCFHCICKLFAELHHNTFFCLSRRTLHFTLLLQPNTFLSLRNRSGSLIMLTPFFPLIPSLYHQQHFSDLIGESLNNTVTHSSSKKTTVFTSPDPTILILIYNIYRELLRRQTLF